MRPLTFLETHELINSIEWMTEDEKKDCKNEINQLQEDGKGGLGYIAIPVKCEKCNTTHNIIHPVGMHFPSECLKCKEMACYVYEKPSPGKPSS